MINRVILTGRLTNDVELRKTNDGTSYVLFTLAVSRISRNSNEQTDFISCIAWRQTSELMNQYLNKGSLIGVEGSLQVYRKETNGNYDTRTNVQVSTITFLETRAKAQERNSGGGSNNSFQTNTTNNDNFSNQQNMTFADEPSFNENQTTQVNNDFGKKEEINADDINLEEIKF